jgi:hypothetical protein
MKKILYLFIFSLGFILNSAHGDFKITSEDLLLKPENVKIRFKHGLFNSHAEVSYRTCEKCEWITYPTSNETFFYSDGLEKTFDEFKFIINSKQTNNKYVLISISHYSKTVRVLKWKYEAD